MAIVDEHFVQAYCQQTSAIKGLEFRVDPAEDESVDAEVQVWLDGAYTNLSVQCGAGYIGVNQYGQDDPEDDSTFWMRNLWLGGVQPADLLTAFTTVVEGLRPALAERAARALESQRA